MKNLAYNRTNPTRSNSYGTLILRHSIPIESELRIENKLFNSIIMVLRHLVARTKRVVQQCGDSCASQIAVHKSLITPHIPKAPA